MIVTLTMNPSLDRTIELAAALERGEVQRAAATGTQPGGKGVNVARALVAAGVETLAILPGDPGDPMLGALDAARIPYRSSPVGGAIRSNVTLTEPDGTTTKINEPGPHLPMPAADRLVELVVDAAVDASWLVLAGSLPPGVPHSFYAELVDRVRSRRPGVRIAVDTSGLPLAALLEGGGRVDLVKPNAEELVEVAEALGIHLPGASEFERDLDAAARAAASLLGPALGSVLLTLGAHGAVLATAERTLTAPAPRVEARSTVGAGDASLAGYLVAAERGLDDEHRLRQAIAHGAAAAALPGSTMPALADTRPDDIVVSDRHDIVVSDRHDIVVSDRHDVVVTDQHDTVVTDQHDTVVTDQHDTVVADRDHVATDQRSDAERPSAASRLQ